MILVKTKREQEPTKLWMMRWLMGKSGLRKLILCFDVGLRIQAVGEMLRMNTSTIHLGKPVCNSSLYKKKADVYFNRTNWTMLRPMHSTVS